MVTLGAAHCRTDPEAASLHRDCLMPGCRCISATYHAGATLDCPLAFCPSCGPRFTHGGSIGFRDGSVLPWLQYLHGNGTIRLCDVVCSTAIGAFCQSVHSAIRLMLHVRSAVLSIACVFSSFTEVRSGWTHSVVMHCCTASTARSTLVHVVRCSRALACASLCLSVLYNLFFLAFCIRRAWAVTSFASHVV